MKDLAIFNIDSYLLEKFQAKVAMENSTDDDVIEDLIRNYIAPKNNLLVNNAPYYAKANMGIPLWAMKPNQNNHRVIRAYFKALKGTSEFVSLNEMLYYCTHAEYQDTYIPPTLQNSSEKRFWNTYNQLKVDSPNSNGKVFEDRERCDRTGRFIKAVTVWAPVNDTLMRYKSYFGG